MERPAFDIQKVEEPSPQIIPIIPDKDNPELRPMFGTAKLYFGKTPVVGIEIGSSTAANACEVVEAWPEITKLYCIDYYPVYSDFPSAEIQNNALTYAILNIIDTPKVHLIIESSIEATKRFKDESIDFVYIDANHSYTFVRDDIQAWLPKVKKGGIIGGHDYDWEDKEHDFELAVKRAVDEAFGDRVHYHISLFYVENRKNRYEPYTGVKSDWWVFV